MKTAITILALGDYWKGAITLYYSLLKYGNLPSSVKVIYLGRNQSIRHDWSWIPVSQSTFSVVASKFEALTLDYDRIIMLDADMLCLGDCSLLWSESLTKPFYAVHDQGTRAYYDSKLKKLGLDLSLIFNAGTMIFNRGGLVLDELLKAIRNGLESYDGGDQGYLNAYFQKIRPDLEVGFLPTEYNCVLDKNFAQVPDEDKRIIHFAGSTNPWNCKVTPDSYRARFFKRWQLEWDLLLKDETFGRSK